jgi:uncharacterized membrane protein
MSKPFLKDLPELVQAHVIDEETAEKIRNHYESKPDTSAHRLVIVFGILGALLVGLGIILIIAHNWDDFGKTIKLTLAMLPLFIGQLTCWYGLLKRSGSVAWREGSATFLLLAIACSISIVSQVYNIEGSLSGFLFIWMLLSLPLIYILRSSLASLLYIIGITWYGIEISYAHYPQAIAWWYWGFLAANLPYYFYLYRHHHRSNFFYFHSWALAISITCVLGMFDNQLDHVTVLLYLNAFAIFILVGQLEKFQSSRLITNGFLIGGSLGTITLLLSMSFEWFWKETYQESTKGMLYLDVNVYTITFALTLALLIWIGVRKNFAALNLKSYAFLAAFFLYIISIQWPDASRILDNLLLFFFGVFTIRDGAQQNRLSVLNYGLLILSALITCRFFDTDMSFVVRGLLFVAVGAGFFAANYWMVRKRKDHLA